METAFVIHHYYFFSSSYFLNYNQPFSEQKIIKTFLPPELGEQPN